MIAWNVRVLEIIHLTTGVKKDSNGNRHKEYTKLSSFHTILKNKNFMIICNRTLSLISKAATVHLAIHMHEWVNNVNDKTYLAWPMIACYSYMQHRE